MTESPGTGAGARVPAPERIVSLLWLLLTHRRTGVTRDYLRRYVDGYAAAPSEQAFERMFSRDKEVLKDIGIPLETSAAPAEGADRTEQPDEVRYRIDQDGMYLPHVDFTNAERLALMRARSAWQGSDVDRAVVRALARLDAGEDWLAATSASDHESFGARLADADRTLTALGDAVRAQSVVAFRYRTAGARHPERRTVRAWALTNPTGVWYLIGWDLDRQDQRTFRLTRMESEPQAVAAGGRPAPARPADLDLGPVHALVSGEREPATVTLHLRPGRAVPLRLGAEPAGRTPDGWDRVVLEYTRPAELAGTVAAAGPAARVPDSSPGVLDAVVRLLDGALAAHRLPVPEYELTEPRRTRNRRSDRDRVATMVDVIGLINQRGAMSRAELADRLEVSSRELDQVLDELRFCGMPERYFAGEQFDVLDEDGLVRITQAEDLSGPLRLSVPEAGALVVGLRASAGIPGLAESERSAARTALEKIVAASGPEVARAADGIVARFDFGPHAALAGRLHSAARDRRVLEITYHAAGRDEQSVREVEPLRITTEGGHGYLQAWCRQQDGLRNFRIDRIAAVRETGEVHSGRAVALDGPLFMPRGTELTAHVLFAHRIRDLAEGFRPERTAVLADGSVVAEVRLASADYARAQAARHGGEFRVLSPDWLVDSVTAWVAEARAGHGVADAEPAAGMP
ncbi:WYL domain-containing protein [Citricoccus sp. SGAir0253]|uniref:helix-turn-helix transcriptional regulator n=1 Tax=Citricoccus sp. SGAir0253 TaxID=2567881 RepID=UPI0010CD5406|nr:WYL domain-containing protein [Citricoccus sp. SGAir0253]QCU78058.1 WYL domain-containing protein [Citricoccus sp. SGAir0253]